MEYNIFDIINPNFFGVLSGKNKRENFLLLFEVYKYFDYNSSSLEAERKKLVEYIADKIKEMHVENLGDDDELEKLDELPAISLNKQKANIFISFLEKRGWLERDRNKEFVDIIQRSDAFIAIFESLMKLIQDETEAKEQSAALLALYHHLKDFDFKNPTSAIENIDHSSNELKKSILSINSKIKRFVDRTMADSTLNEKEILEKLTVDYQKMSAFISFHNLLTFNNPNKYKRIIVDRINELSANENMLKFIDDYCRVKALSKNDPENIKKADSYINAVFSQVLNQIENIENDLDIISLKNRAYTATSVDRIRFRLNNEKDIKGDVIQLLKLFSQENISKDATFEFKIYPLKQLDDKSLFAPRMLPRVAPKTTPFVKHELPPEAILKAQEIIRNSQMYSINNINEFVLNQLKRNKVDSTNVSNFLISSIEEFIKTMLIPVFSSNSDAKYRISKPNNKYFYINEYQLDDYEVIKKE